LLKSFKLGIQSIIDNYRDYITIENEWSTRRCSCYVNEFTVLLPS
jgi:hypothetical protein